VSQIEILICATGAAAVLAFLTMIVCLVKLGGQRATLDRILTALATPGGMSLGASIDGFSKRSEDISERNRAVLTAMDQGLRETLAASAREGLVAAFDKVQEGSKAQAEALGTFTASLQEAVGGIGARVEVLTEQVNGASERLHAAIMAKLGGAAVSAAEARADLARDLAVTVAEARERTETALRVFGEEQGKRLDAITTALGEAEIAAAQARADLLRDLSGTVTGSREQTEAALRMFGAEQGERLDAVATASREGSAATAREFGEFRNEVVGRLEAVRTATVETLGKSVETLGGISTAMASAQATTERALGEQREAVLKELAEA
jgi:hypothetical protein